MTQHPAPRRPHRTGSATKPGAARVLGCWALRVLVDRVRRRPPDRNIGPGYMLRWYAWPRNKMSNLYVHEFLRSDDDRALHDHPWWSVSVCLSGEMIEHLPSGRVRCVRAGDVRLRSARHAHRLELVSDRALTLFLTGPVVRTWGFHCPQGWRHWRDFTAGPNGESIGRGCD